MNIFMEKANNLAEKNLKSNAGGPFGACIVKNNKIIGKGNNSVLKDNDPTAHAEINAIRDACKKLNTYDLSGCTIYTTCYPCPMCLSAIIWANIDKVYYGNTKEDAEDIGFRDDFIYDYIKNMDESVLKLKCIDRAKTIKIFEEYKEKDDKTIY